MAECPGESFRPDRQTQMTFEETLAALLALNGRLVEVSITGIDGSPPLAAVDRGQLERADALTSPAVLDDRGETFFFTLGEGTGFFLARKQFAGASWTGPCLDTLAADVGSVRILVEAVEGCE